MSAQTRTDAPPARLREPSPAPAAAAGPTLGAAFTVLRRRRAFLAAWVLGWTLLAALVILQLRPSYRAEALLMLDTREISFSEVRSVVSGPSTENMDSTVTRSEVEVLSSEGLSRQVVVALDLVNSEEFAARPSRRESLFAALAVPVEGVAGLTGVGADAAAWLRGRAGGGEAPTPEARLTAVVEAYRNRLSVFNDGRSYAIAVAFAASDPVLAARVANTHVQTYIDDQRRMKNEALAAATAWLDREVQTLAARLQTAEARAREFRERQRLLEPRGTSIAAQQLVIARADRAQREARERRVRDLATPPASAERADPAVLARLRAQETAARRTLAEAERRLPDSHPTVAARRGEVAALAARVAAEQARGPAGVRVPNDQRSIEELEARVAATERAEAEAEEMAREALSTRSLYESLVQRQKQVLTQEGIQQADARVVSAAAVPLRASFPNKTLFLAVAGIVATVTGAGLVLLRERMRDRIGSVPDVEAATGLRCLAVLPLIGRRWNLQGRNFGLARAVATRPRSVAAESIRTLRHALAVSERGEAPPRLIAVASSLPGEGKTTVALALARSFALSGLNVLLVEGDLRRPSLGRVFGDAPVRTGLAAAVTGRAPLDVAVRQDPATSLHVLAAEGDIGNAADLLASRGFADLLQGALATHDYVIVDTPPVGAVSDGLIIARAVEAVLLVVRADASERDAATAAARALADSGAPVAGVVLNALDPRFGGGSHYPGHDRRAARGYFRD